MSKRYQVKEKQVRRINKVFNHLKKHLPKAYHAIQLGLVFTEMKNYKTYQGGYAVEGTINIGTEFVNVYKTEPELASILGHELGHHVLGHMTIDGEERSITPPEEQDADQFGMFLCELAGYKRKDFIDHCRKFEKKRKKTLTAKHKKEHGSGDERVERLEEQDKYLTNLSNE